MATLSAEEKLTGLVARVKKAGEKLSQIGSRLEVVIVAVNNEDWRLDHSDWEVDLEVVLEEILYDLRLNVGDEIDWSETRSEGE